MRNLLLALLLLPLFSTRCCAEELYDQAGALTEAYRVEEALPGTGRDITGGLRLDGSYDARGALERLAEHVLQSVRDRLEGEKREALRLVLLPLLTALCACFVGGGEWSALLDRMSCCALSLLLAEGVDGLFAAAREALQQLSDYSRAVLPVLFTTAAVGGAAASAPARYAASCLALDVMMTASQRCILPMIYAYIALTVSLSLHENAVLQALQELCKWGVTTALSVLTLGFTAYLSLTGLIVGSADALAVKTARTILSKSLPVVGGLLSDSASVLLSAAQIVKNSVGVFALVAVCALCAGPLVLVLVKLLVFKTAAAASGFLPNSHIPKLVGGFGNAFGMLAGLLGAHTVLLFVSIYSGIRAAVPL